MIIMISPSRRLLLAIASKLSMTLCTSCLKGMSGLKSMKLVSKGTRSENGFSYQGFGCGERAEARPDGLLFTGEGDLDGDLEGDLDRLCW